MFDEDELEALVLGARLVERQGDGALAASAANALAKIAAAAPKNLRDTIADVGMWALGRLPETPSLKPLREAIRREHKVTIAYSDEKGATITRTIWPIALGFFDGRQVAVAWCELRDDFRHFRTDRVRELAPTGERYPRRRATLVKEWRAQNSIPPRK
jgi:predicted DNA-binding transcriptional regulator YafY